MCFGNGGDDSASREMIQMQKDEAIRVAQKEAEREGRIKGGLKSIRAMFEGSPVMKNVANKFDWKKFNPAGAPGAATGKIAGQAVSGLPAGYTYVSIPGTTTTASGKAGKAGTAAKAKTVDYLGGHGATQPLTMNDPKNYVGGHGATQPQVAAKPGDYVGGHGATQPLVAARPTTTTTPATWGIKGPDGKIYKIGQDVTYQTQADTGQKKGAWQQKFYDKYMQTMRDYYMPQVAEQFGKASDETKYRHARAGTGVSTANIMNVADLGKQNLLRQGEVEQKAQSGAADLKERVGKEKAAAEAQLYATENPEVAANQASAAINAISAEEAPQTPLGEIFNIATIGGANLLKGAANASRYGGGYGSSSIGRNQKILGS